MPLTIPEALDAHDAAAVTKAGQARTGMARYLLSSLLAGVYVGVAIVLLLLTTSAPLLAVGSPFAKLGDAVAQPGLDGAGQRRRRRRARWLADGWLGTPTRLRAAKPAPPAPSSAASPVDEPEVPTAAGYGAKVPAAA